ncbi:hypothetical protein [Paenibacillus sp. DMB5]|uniref:hypothetical protein n=1 Tax=Paenibacillus sp. DMB5 TaxID=1780103 RepID=UPI0018E3C6A2|nr:hypothetical protein [Paenibacillus sp. DMB5]
MSQGCALLYTTQRRLREKAAIEVAGRARHPVRQGWQPGGADRRSQCWRPPQGAMTARDKPSSASRRRFSACELEESLVTGPRKEMGYESLLYNQRSSGIVMPGNLQDST